MNSGLLMVAIGLAFCGSLSFGQKLDTNLRPGQDDTLSRWFGSEYDLYNKLNEQNDMEEDFGQKAPAPSDFDFRDYEKEKMEKRWDMARERDAILRRRHNPKFVGDYPSACKKQTSCEDICRYFFPELVAKHPGCASEVSWGVTKCKCSC